MMMGHPVPWFDPADTDLCFCGSGQLFGRCCGNRTDRITLPAGIQVFPGFVDSDKCRKWVQRLERQPRVRAMVKDARRSTSTHLVSVEDPTRVCHDVKPGVLRKVINEQIIRGFKLAIGDSGRHLLWFETPRILRYEPGGFYIRHSDSCQLDEASNTWYKIQDRDLSMLIYLNEDYTGGGLTFTNFHFHYRPRTGDLLVFPSDNRYAHQAERVKSGIRYAIASWAAFEGIPKVCAAPPLTAIDFQRA